MTIKAELLVPDIDTDVPLDTEIVINLFDDGGLPINPSTVDITLDTGGGLQAVLTGSSFVGDWTGEIIDNSLNYSNITIVLIRPVGEPTFPSGTKITAHVEAVLV